MSLRVTTGAIGMTCLFAGVMLAESTSNLNTEMVLLSLVSMLFGGFMLTMTVLMDGRTY